MRNILLVCAIAFLSLTVSAAGPGKTFPFTQAQNQDGAKFVWFIYGDAGFSYDYVPAKDLPNSEHFHEASTPQNGDVAWWPGFVAIVKMENGKIKSYLTAENERSPDALEVLYGKPRFYTYIVFEKK